MDTQVKTDVSQLRVDGPRLWASLMELAQIGATPKGGVCRLALTDLDRQGRERVIGWGRDAGLAITTDRIGDVFMRRAGRRPELPPVMTGSHIDTQPTGGKFDGNYGVLAGLEVVRTLNDHGVLTDAPIEVAFWTNEEGSRFVPVMMGSGVFAKAFTLEHAYAAKDTEGKSVKDECDRLRSQALSAALILETIDLPDQTSASLGVSNFPLHCETAEELFAMADEALYKAKGDGRNCVKIASPVHK